MARVTSSTYGYKILNEWFQNKHWFLKLQPYVLKALTIQAHRWGLDGLGPSKSNLQPSKIVGLRLHSPSFKFIKCYEVIYCNMLGDKASG